MKHLSGLAALVLLLAAPPALAADDGGCHLTRIAALDMSISAAGHITVPMTVGGQNLTLAIDTGAINTMIDQSTVTALGLHPEIFNNVRITMFGGRRIDRYVVAHDIFLGGLKAHEMTFLVLPDGAIASDVQGLLAPDIMRAYDDDFDFANMKFSLFDPSRCDGNLVYWSDADHAEIPFTLDSFGHIELPVTLDGQEMRVHLDTGAAASVFDLETAESLFGFDEKDPRLMPLGHTKNGFTYRFPFKTLTFGGVTVNNPQIVLISREDSHHVGPTHGLIGIGILRQLHIYMSYRQRKMFVTAASAH